MINGLFCVIQVIFWLFIENFMSLLYGKSHLDEEINLNFLIVTEGAVGSSIG